MASRQLAPTAGYRHDPPMSATAETHDRAGQIRHAQISEGNYSGTEAAIRALLAEGGDATTNEKGRPWPA